MSETLKSLSIGQVIYVLSNKDQKIIPAIVVEEVTIKKLDGNHVSWKLSVGPKGKEKIIDSTRLDGDIHMSLEEIKEVLKGRLMMFLDNVIKEAEKRSVSWYGEQTVRAIPESQSSAFSEKIDPNTLIDDLESPQVQQAPKMPGMGQTQSPASAASAILRQRMQNIADPDVPFGDGGTVGSEEVTLPSGQRVKLNIKT